MIGSMLRTSRYLGLLLTVAGCTDREPVLNPVEGGAGPTTVSPSGPPRPRARTEHVIKVVSDEPVRSVTCYLRPRSGVRPGFAPVYFAEPDGTIRYSWYTADQDLCIAAYGHLPTWVSADADGGVLSEVRLRPGPSFSIHLGSLPTQVNWVLAPAGVLPRDVAVCSEACVGTLASGDNVRLLAAGSDTHIDHWLYVWEAHRLAEPMRFLPYETNERRDLVWGVDVEVPKELERERHVWVSPVDNPTCMNGVIRLKPTRASGRTKIALPIGTYCLYPEFELDRQFRITVGR